MKTIKAFGKSIPVIAIVMMIFMTGIAGAMDSRSVDMSVTCLDVQPMVGISVDTHSVDFGNLTPGVASTLPVSITVTNIGDLNASLFASIIEEPVGVFTSGLAIDNSTVRNWNSSVAAPMGTEDLSLVLTLPVGTAPGAHSATLIFWAESAAAV